MKIFRQKVSAKAFQNALYTETINGQTITVRDYDHEGKILLAYGTAAASTQNLQSRYAKGAEYIKTDVTTGSAAKYQNIGTSASSSFDLITVATTGDIAEVIAGNGLTGGGSSGSVTVDVVGGNGIQVGANSIAAQGSAGIVVDPSGISVATSVYNDTGGTLTAGTLVTVDGFDNTNGITVVKADAANNLPATHIVKDDILNAAAGTVYPVLQSDTDLNTGGTTIGDKVYLSTTTGQFTFTPPTGSDHIQQVVGVVKVVDAANGQIEWFPGARLILKLNNSALQDASVNANKIAGGAVGEDKIQAVATAADSAIVSIPKVLTWDWENTDPDGNNDIILYNANLPEGIEILDAWLDMTTAEGGAMTVTLRDAVNGGGNAITSAMDANSTSIERTTSLANQALAANSSLVANFSANPGTAVGRIVVLFRRTT